MSSARIGGTTRIASSLRAIGSGWITSGVGNGVVCRVLRSLSLPGACLCVLICALPVAAQQAGSEAGPAEATDADAQAAAGEGAGSSWSIACRALGPGQTACSLAQRQVLETGAVLLQLDLVGVDGRVPPALLITTPLGTHLADGVALSVDEAPLGEAVFDQCRQQGCTARFASGDLVARRMRSGGRHDATPAPGDVVPCCRPDCSERGAR